MSRKIAAVDIGTNTFRILIGELQEKGEEIAPCIIEHYSGRAVVRLGEGVAESNMLHPDAISRGLTTLKKFRETAEKHGVSGISAVATSVLREAENGREFMETVRRETGIVIRTVTGGEEAALTARGILFDIDIPSTALLADIGGGSTELVFMRNGIPEKFESRKIGVVYLADKYMKADPPDDKDIAAMEDEISYSVKQYMQEFRNLLDESTMMIGTAGTITAISAMNLGLQHYDRKQTHHSRLTRAQASDIYDRIVKLTSAERQKMIPFEPQRTDIIVPGAFILLSLLDSASRDEILVTDCGILEGILIDMYQKQMTEDR
jgi:exopolyphosphatase/guanosine-5'-triphosphate,3'-diphosphate pyrophosphatase